MSLIQQIGVALAYARATHSDKALRKRRRVWHKKQALANPGRYYGDIGTIHNTTELDVCLNKQGDVVQVWFRCQALPFNVSASRDREPIPDNELPLLTGVEVRDKAQVI